MATGLYSRTCVRKISTNICTVVQAVLIVALVYSGCNELLVNGFLLLAMTVSGASTSGPLSIMVDLSPNFASKPILMINYYCEKKKTADRLIFCAELLRRTLLEKRRFRFYNGARSASFCLSVYDFIYNLVSLLSDESAAIRFQWCF